MVQSTMRPVRRGGGSCSTGSVMTAVRSPRSITVVGSAASTGAAATGIPSVTRRRSSAISPPLW